MIARRAMTAQRYRRACDAPCMARTYPVYVESGARKVFACSVDLPGWCRSGRDEAAALDALAEYAGRYAVVAQRAGVRFSVNPSLEVVERVDGSGATDFGVPDRVPAVDLEPIDRRGRRRLADLVASAWAVFDDVVAASPPTLRKGPRGGGRDRDPIVEHVVGAEASYARQLGVRLKAPAHDDRAAIEANRSALIEAIVDAPSGAVEKGWPVRYAARRIAWHVLDHAWEIEDKREPA